MRILFYLPAVTPWWFDQVIEPLIRRVAPVADVHVLAPAPWQNTGIGPDQLQRCADLDRVQWSIVDDSDHPSLRSAPTEPGAVIAFVRTLAPDLVLCRSADLDTPRQFPGIVRHVMEAVIAPFDLGARTNMVHFTDAPFVQGRMPTLSPADAVRLEAMIAPFWEDMQAHWATVVPDRAAVYRAYGVPLDRPVVLLPLEYAHAENFYRQHRPASLSDEALVAHAAALADAAGVTLVVTDHPLNALHADRVALHAAVAALGTPILADPTTLALPPTLALLRHADGALLGDSKTFGIAAAFGTPMARLSRFESAPWLHMEQDLPRFFAAVAAGTAARPDTSAARRWFGYHYAEQALHPTDPALDGAGIIARATSPLDPARWPESLRLLERYAAPEELAA
ncbi:hypothetical protein [uncultured Sphingomonas sp.]|uniref:hypothetical protein n=1 Tax=uncultured Sphingomonas sp. TaxID=158754 RepID=UPI0025F4FD06|nr:hypothetical protein [uncultured Sphingomonas sp.]